MAMTNKHPFMEFCGWKYNSSDCCLVLAVDNRHFIVVENEWSAPRGKGENPVLATDYSKYFLLTSVGFNSFLTRTLYFDGKVFCSLVVTTQTFICRPLNNDSSSACAVVTESLSANSTYANLGKGNHSNANAKKYSDIKGSIFLKV